ncbi:hypothetical protein V2J09_017725 [Rumex salicifolius]
MDSFEAARAVFSRIQRVDPDNAHKIVTHILLQEKSEKEMIRLAFGTENLIHSTVAKAKAELGLSSNTSSALHYSASFSPISSPVTISRPPFSLSSAVHNPSSPSSPSIWSISSSSNHLPLSPDAKSSLSYAVLNGTNVRANSFSSSFNRADSLHGDNSSFLTESLEPSSKSIRFSDQFTEMAMEPGCRTNSFPYSSWEKGNTFENGQLHHRSCFANEDFSSGLNYKSRGLCNTVYGGASSVDSFENQSTRFDAFEHYKQEFIRSKAAQQQRLAAAQYMPGMNSPHSKLNFLQGEAQTSGAAALLLDELHNLNGLMKAGTDNSDMEFGDNAPSSRQIYLTFPADSTFKEEDVSNYFSIYGPVQDVRIPYQQKRMYGFVTFVYPETVQIILTKGNPHFVCDSRVLVKPYKEKAKLTDKKQQHLDRYEFLSCSCSSLLDKEPFEMHVGPRLLYNNQEMLKKKLEQEVHWQQTLEFQRRRLMNIQLEDLKNNYHYKHDFSDGYPSHLTDNHETSLHQNIPPKISVFQEDALEENQGSLTASPNKEPHDEVSANSDCSNDNKEYDMELKLSNDVLESPSASAAMDTSILAPETIEADSGVTASTSTSTTNMTPPESCFLETPRYSRRSEKPYVQR